MESTLTRDQKKMFRREFMENGEMQVLTVTLRYDDECGNRHNTFAVTATQRRKGRRIDCCGCMHSTVVKVFPEFEPLVKWHLCSSDGPLHYVANTVHHAEQLNYDAARRTAIWLDAADVEFSSNNLASRLDARLPALLARFAEAMTELGFVY